MDSILRRSSDGNSHPSPLAEPLLADSESGSAPRDSPELTDDTEEFIAEQLANDEQFLSIQPEEILQAPPGTEIIAGIEQPDDPSLRPVARTFARPEFHDPGCAFVELEEDDLESVPGTPTGGPDTPSGRSQTDGRSPLRRRLFNAPDSEPPEEQHRVEEMKQTSDDNYTYQTTVIESLPDDASFSFDQEAEARRVLQQQKMEEAAARQERGSIRRGLQRNNFFQRIWKRLVYKIRQRHNTFIFLTMTGVLTGAVGVSMDFLINEYALGHTKLTYTTSIWPVQFLLWFVYLYAMFAVGVLAVRYISLSAIGSGLPEMKSVLSGVTLVEYLTFRTLIAKIVGLTCAIGSGIVVGKLGPFVHIASIIANQLFSLPLFNRIRQSGSFRQQMLTCAVATGVAANFGAPIAGILFSIELTTTYYPVRNYFYTAWAAMCSGFTFRFIWNARYDLPIFTALAPTAFAKTGTGLFTVTEVFGAVLLGILGGLIGVCFIFLHLSVVRYRRKGALRFWVFKSPYPYTILIATVTAVLLFPELIGDYMNLLPMAAFKNLAVIGSLDNATALDWLDISVWVSVPLFLLSRFWLTGLSISMPIPCGLFVPFITVGAGVGRLFGEAVYPSLDPLLDPTMELPGIMAIVGAAAVGAGVTQTFSVAVLMFELTGQIILLVPVVIAVVVAVGVSRQLSYNVYDGILKSRNLPYLPDIRSRGHSMRAIDIMDTAVVDNHQYLTRKTTYQDLVSTLKSSAHLPHLAVVDSHENQLLLGVVTRSTLEELIENYRQEMEGIADNEDDSKWARTNPVSHTLRNARYERVFFPEVENTNS